MMGNSLVEGLMHAMSMLISMVTSREGCVARVVRGRNGSGAVMMAPDMGERFVWEE